MYQTYVYCVKLILVPGSNMAKTISDGEEERLQISLLIP